MKSGVNSQIVCRCTQSQARIRVAILDTGYDRNSIFFWNSSRKSRVRGWKDWVGNLPKARAEDLDGHGTHVVSLVMKMAPAADIYVARVAKDTDGLQGASRNVAEVPSLARRPKL